MRRRLAPTVGAIVLTTALALTGCDDAKSSATGVPDKPSVEKQTKSGKGKLASDEQPQPPVR